MPRNSHNARITPKGLSIKGLNEGLSSTRTDAEPTLTSTVAAQLATRGVEVQVQEKKDREFTKAVIGIWGRPNAPRGADAFWQRNSQVPDYFKRMFGSIIGWAVLESHKPTDLGGAANQAMGLYDPLRLTAGKLAKQALIEACGGNEETFTALSQPIPEGITQTSYYGYSNPEELGFRLAEYPPAGSQVEVVIGRSRFMVGDHSYDHGRFDW